MVTVMNMYDLKYGDNRNIVEMYERMHIVLYYAPCISNTTEHRKVKKR